MAYFSRCLSGKSRLFSTYDLELLTLVLVVEKWKQYLLGSRFEVYMDHESLKHLLEQKINTSQKQKLMAFDFVNLYKKGKDNKATDASL